MNYYVKEVSTRKDMDDFVRLPSVIYKDNPYYVPDLESDIRDFFNPKKNPGMQFSKIQAFNAYDDNGDIVGRVAGVINYKANSIWNNKCVRFGMIEFIDNQAVSTLLIEAVEKWGAYNGMTRIQGPMGLTDFDKEGMLIEDFDEIGSMITIYNPPYYPEHMEKLGFEKEADWIQVRFDIPKQLPERFGRVAGLVNEMYDLHVRKLTSTDIYKRGYGQRIFDLLNKAYRPLFGFAELSPEISKKFINQYFPLADLRMIPVIEDNNNRIIAVAITIGSLSHALIKSKGRLWPTGWIHLLKALKIKHEDKVEMMLVAVDPEFQGVGINSLLFVDLIKVYNKLGYKWAETGPMLETNKKVLTQWKSLHPRYYKRRRCFGKDIEKYKYINSSNEK